MLLAINNREMLLAGSFTVKVEKDVEVEENLCRGYGSHHSLWDDEEDEDF